MRDRTVLVGGVRLGRGGRVRLRPSPGADILDLALTGRTAEIDAVEEDMEGRVHVAVVLDDDPAGIDFGTSGQMGHRFFFSPQELEPAGPAEEPAAPRARVLVAGIGNVFLADDGFGPAVAEALRERPLPDGVHVADFGIRGMDLAYRLLEGYDTAVLVDAAPHGQTPGTVSVIEPDAGAFDGAHAAPEAHAMDPVRTLALARRLAADGGAGLPRVLVVGCEPLVRMRGDEPDVAVGLSEPVRRAVGEAVGLVEYLVEEVLAGNTGKEVNR
ncbi:hydrogenase maturation protease [Streptomyces nanhaiensis]|uniref:hydrogenase maturation protease n=1 Tax=Streptomyces nanhaiensis TaxID=679319 RepID=UPI00399CFB12